MTDVTLLTEEPWLVKVISKLMDGQDGPSYS